MKVKNQQTVLIYDGYCNLCSGLVDFVAKRDRQSKIIYLPYQDEQAKTMLQATDGVEIEKLTPSTVYLIQGDKAYKKSTAALLALKTIGEGWQYLYFLRFLPKSIRDWVYDFVAKNRFRVFGKRKSCYVVGQTR